MSNVVAEEYASSLSDLTVNSKPLINGLTMIAEENIDHAPAIVQAVEKHLQNCVPNPAGFRHRSKIATANLASSL